MSRLDPAPSLSDEAIAVLRERLELAFGRKALRSKNGREKFYTALSLANAGHPVIMMRYKGYDWVGRVFPWQIEQASAAQAQNAAKPLAPSLRRYDIP